MQNENIISIKDLTYQFNKQQVILDELGLEIPAGSIYGFLGPNGAGLKHCFHVCPLISHNFKETVLPH